METESEKFALIEELIARDHNLLNITWLCQICEVSRSGYYSWINSKDIRNQKEMQDQKDFELILEAYSYRGYDKGSRGIHMRLLQNGIIMNRKKIQRLMAKYNLLCPIRKPNPYRRMAKAKAENCTKPNLLNREFKTRGRREVLLTDITYLFYGRGQKAYLSVIKDAKTNQILSYVPSKSLEEDFVLATINQLFEKDLNLSKSENTLIHSDQGVHYTSLQFQKLLEDKELRQSMSRRGNCWDNAPIESFFGHMKCEIRDLNQIDTFEELTMVIDDYMDYYNNERYQWNLAKLSPNQYDQYLIDGVYPLEMISTI